MGCDIHTYVEVKGRDYWELSKKKVFHNIWYDPNSKYMNEEAEYIDVPFDWRSYGLFGFFADVRNYSFSPVISEPRGLPDDVSKDVLKESDCWDMDGHSHSYLTLKELIEYDYDTTFEDRRTTRNGDGAADAGEGNGKKTTLREFLGDEYFQQIADMRKLGEPDKVRMVFWFDN